MTPEGFFFEQWEDFEKRLSHLTALLQETVVPILVRAADANLISPTEQAELHLYLDSLFPERFES